MTAYDDQTDTSAQSTQDPDGTGSAAESLAGQPGGLAQTSSAIGGSDESVDPSGDPGGDSDLGTTEDDMSGQGPGVDGSDADRGNLDGSTPSEDSREDSLDNASEAVRDPSEASDDPLDPTSYTGAGDSGQDNGRAE